MRELYIKISERWNRCERLLKKAERVRGEVVAPSVNELRYAGRRFVDAISLLSNDKISDEEQAEAQNYLNEAFLFCMRAEHDCVDAIVMYAHMLIETYSRIYGAMLLMQACPSLEKYRLIKPEIDQLIQYSREERIKRDDLYQNIIENHLEQLIQIASSMEMAEPIIKQEKINRRNEKIINYAIGLTGLALAVYSVL
jgi:hypothetical protein